MFEKHHLSFSLSVQSSALAFGHSVVPSGRNNRNIFIWLFVSSLDSHSSWEVGGYFTISLALRPWSD